MLELLIVLAGMLILAGMFFVIDMATGYIEECEMEAPTSATPHSFSPFRGHLAGLAGCTECDHPEGHPIHGEAKK